MSDLEIRQGTVYEESATGKRLLVINHNPMALRSLGLDAAGKDSPFDIGHPRIITVDELIALRQSGVWKDLGDIPAESVKKLAETLLTLKVIPDEDIPFIEALLKE